MERAITGARLTSLPSLKPKRPLKVSKQVKSLLTSKSRKARVAVY
jgi:hypothetical protein